MALGWCSVSVSMVLNLSISYMLWPWRHNLSVYWCIPSTQRKSAVSFLSKSRPNFLHTLPHLLQFLSRTYVRIYLHEILCQPGEAHGLLRDRTYPVNALKSYSFVVRRSSLVVVVNNKTSHTMSFSNEIHSEFE